MASPPGPGRRGVLRLSGSRTADIVRALWVGDPPALEARGAFTGRIGDGRGTQPALLLWMPAPRSFTREDVAELHLMGAPPLVAVALERVLALGARAARGGEFTRRAFEHGRLDLTRAEGVLALVRARNDDERRAASQLCAGGLAQRIDALRDALADARALAEASLDFDEADTGHVPDAELTALVRRAREMLGDALDWEERRGAVGGEPRVLLSGAPNAGKSLLFNRLGRGAALVSDRAGTTRDALAATWTVRGVRCRLLDTAGLDAGGFPAHAAEGTDARTAGAHEGAREVDRAAQARARAELAAADLVLWVVDATRADLPALLDERDAFPVGTPRLLVWNQVDREDAASAPPDELVQDRAGDGATSWVAVSGRTGLGVDELERGVARALGWEAEGGSSAPSSAEVETTGTASPARELTARHRRALRAAAEGVDRALAERTAGAPLDLFAAALAEATRELDEIQGRTTPDDVLDRVFARFCIGK